MQSFLRSKRLLLVGTFGIVLFVVIACSLFIFSGPFSVYPNARFERVEDFSISRDTFPFIITAPNNTLPPCVRVAYKLVFHTGDRPSQVAEWFQDMGWSTGVGNNRASGMQSSVTDLPFVNFANWMWVSVRDQSGGPVQINIDRVHIVCMFL